MQTLLNKIEQAEKVENFAKKELETELVKIKKSNILDKVEDALGDLRK